MEATTSKEGGLNERGPKAIAHEMGLQVSHGVHSEVGGIQCGGIHQGEECNLDCPELSGTETPFDREEFLSARLFRFHGGDGQTIRAGIHLAAGAGGAAFGGAEHGVGASAAFRRLLKRWPRTGRFYADEETQGELKAKVALEALRGDRTLQEIASKHQVHPNQVSTWKRQAMEGLGEMFSNGVERRRRDHESEVRELHAKIGELTVERDFLSRGSGR